jgi:hypothetical protein
VTQEERKALEIESIIAKLRKRLMMLLKMRERLER